MPYGTESKSRNADFISVAAERQSATFSAAGAVAPLSEANITRRRQAATTLGAQPRQPSHRRCVQRRSGPLQKFIEYLQEENGKYSDNDRLYIFSASLGKVHGSQIIAGHAVKAGNEAQGEEDLAV